MITLKRGRNSKQNSPEASAAGLLLGLELSVRKYNLEFPVYTLQVKEHFSVSQRKIKERRENRTHPKLVLSLLGLELCSSAVFLAPFELLACKCKDISH